MISKPNKNDTTSNKTGTPNGYVSIFLFDKLEHEEKLIWGLSMIALLNAPFADVKEELNFTANLLLEIGVPTAPPLKGFISEKA